MSGIDTKMAELLVEAGALSRDQLDEMLASQLNLGEERIAQELFEIMLEHERKCAEALARKVGTPALVISESTLDLAAMEQVPEPVAAGRGILPVGMDDTTITLAATDISARFLFDQVAFAAARRVVVLAGLPPLLKDAIPAAYAMRRAGQRVIVGQKSTKETPFLAIARPVQQQTVLDSDALFGEIEAEIKKSIVVSNVSTPLAQLAGLAGAAPAKAPAAVNLGSALAALPQVTAEATPPPQPADDLRRALEEAGEAEAKRAGLPRSGEGPPIPNALMLVVEDDPEIAKLLARAFEFDGFKVLEAHNGSDAIRILRETRPDVVLLDAMLPHVHGFQICAAMKGSAEMRGIPVVMISAVYKGWEQAREIQETHGADAFVEKPFEVHYVRKLVAGLLKRSLDRMPPTPDVASAVGAVRQVLEEHRAAGRLNEAMQQVDMWVSVDPFDAVAYLEMGNLKSQAGDLIGALGAYESAAVYAPEMFAAQLNLARFYEKLGFNRRAKETYAKARDVAPDAATRARIEQHLGR